MGVTFQSVPGGERALFGINPFRLLARKDMAIPHSPPGRPQKRSYVVVRSIYGEGHVGRFRASPGEIEGLASDLAEKTDELILIGEFAGLTTKGAVAFRSVARAMTDIAKNRRDPLSPEALTSWVGRAARRLMGAAARDNERMIAEAMDLLDFDYLVATGEKWLATEAGITGVFNNPSAGMIMAQRVQTSRILAQVIRQTTRGAVKIPSVGRNIGSGFRVRDKAVSRGMMRHHGFFVRNQYGNISQGLARRVRPIVAQGLDAGMGRRQIGRELRNQMRDGLRMPGYWNTVAANAVTRSRSYSLGNSFRAAGITHYRIYAIVDENTTETCLMLHEQILPVDRAMNNLETAMASNRPEDTLTLLPFIEQDGAEFRTVYPDGSSTLIATRTGEGQYNRSSAGVIAGAGVGFPPYHHTCRTTVVPEVR